MQSVPSQLAPIALFVYRRPERAERLLASLLENAEAKLSDLIIYSDGAKSPEAESDVKKMRDLVRGVTGFKSVTVIERERNLGLANSIVDGVSTQCEQHGRVIVLEEDLAVSPYFLAYMNDALTYYEDEERVMQVAGHLFPFDLKVKEDAVFLPLTSSWGWATWGRAWKKFDPEAKGYEVLMRDPALRHAFDLGGAYPYFDMLRNQIEGMVDSWGVRWHLSVFMSQGLILYPCENMVVHEGWDSTATHAKNKSGMSPESFSPEFKVTSFPSPQCLPENERAVTRYFQAYYGRTSRFRRALVALRSRFRRLSLS